MDNMSGYRPKKMFRLLSRFCLDEEGPTAAEYAILLALIILVSVATISSIGKKFLNLYILINSGVGDVSA
jgi:Flp pilus assembly pilin Flp